MSLSWNEIFYGIDDAETTLKNADTQLDKMVRLVSKRLRQVQTYRGRQALCKMKKALRNYNMRTGEWKD